jgi:AraC-like DNA-binding protein
VDRWIWVFILPFLASIVSLQPYFQIPISEKIAFFRLANATDVDNDFFAHASRWIPIQFFQYSILIINSVFFFYCIFILIKARKSTSKIIKKRINNFLGILGTIALLTYLPSLIVYTFVYSNSNYFLNGVITVKSFPPLRYLSIFTLLTPILILFFPNWLYANQVNANQTSKWDLFLSKYLDKNCDIDKPETPQIDEDLTRIMTFLKDEQQYLNPLLSIHEISKSLDIPQARVTYFFNKVLKVPFPRLRNQLRIEHAIELMAQNAHLSLSIEGIAMQSGFKNKSTFYIAFKDEKGMTPIDWINKQIS